MNKKLISLAFVSAAFFFACTADGSFNSGITPPEWDNAPSATPGGGGSGSSGSSGEYCRISAFGEAFGCLEMPADECNAIAEESMGLSTGTVVSSCPD